MRFKHALTATTAAMFLTAGGFAMAQQATPPAAAPDKPAAQSQPTAPSGAGSAMDKSTASLPPSSLHEVKDDKLSVKTLNISAKELGGMDVYGSDGKKIGDVNKILADNSNEIKAVTLDVGGFLGIGAREVVLPIDKLQKGTEKDRLQVSMTKADIEKLEKWEESGRDRSSPPPARTAPGGSPTR